MAEKSANDIINRANLAFGFAHDTGLTNRRGSCINRYKKKLSMTSKIITNYTIYLRNSNIIKSKYFILSNTEVSYSIKCDKRTIKHFSVDFHHRFLSTITNILD